MKSAKVAAVLLLTEISSERLDMTDTDLIVIDQFVPLLEKP